jgi:hypothetical protein
MSSRYTLINILQALFPGRTMPATHANKTYSPVSELLVRLLRVLGAARRAGMEPRRNSDAACRSPRGDDRCGPGTRCAQDGRAPSSNSGDAKERGGGHSG